MSLKELIECIKKGEEAGKNCTWEIIARIKKGGENERIAKELYSAFYGYHFKLAKDFQLDVSEVLSIYVEAVSLLIYNIKIDKFKNDFPKAFSSFIFKVCKNQCITLKKKNQREVNIPDQNEIHSREDEKEPPSSDNPADFDGNVLEDDDVRICFQKLSPNCQKLFLLKAKGFNMKEIIQQIDGINTVGSASATKNKCMKDLKECIKKRRERNKKP